MYSPSAFWPMTPVTVTRFTGSSTRTRAPVSSVRSTSMGTSASSVSSTRPVVSQNHWAPMSSAAAMSVGAAVLKSYWMVPVQQVNRFTSAPISK